MVIKMRPFVNKLQNGFSFLVHRVFDEVATTTVPVDVKEGHFVVFAVNREETQRFVVDLKYLTNPAFLRLLEIAEEEYGFKQKGPLKVPCRPQDLQRILEEARC